MDTEPATGVDLTHSSQTDTDGDMDDDLFIDENASPLHQDKPDNDAMMSGQEFEHNVDDENDIHEKILLEEATQAIQDAEANVGFQEQQNRNSEHDNGDDDESRDTNHEQQHQMEQDLQNNQEEQNLEHQKQLQHEQANNQQQQRRIHELEREVQQLKNLLREREDNQDKIRMCLQKEHLIELNRKENIFKMSLALKEQELQDALRQIEALKQQRIPTSTTLESYLLDPALNFMFEKMRKEVEESKTRVEDMQNDLNAWKFTPDSATGKRLMAKCSQLHQENEDLGRMISSGKVAKLESILAMHEKIANDDKCKQTEIEEALLDMEEDIEGLQNTVYFLQQQLREEKELTKDLTNKCKELETTTSSSVQATES